MARAKNAGRGPGGRAEMGLPPDWSGSLLYRYILIEVALGHAEAYLIRFAKIRSRIV
jgi:hypothetical protein